MTVFNPNDAEHTLKVIPRYYPENIIFLQFFNEETRQSENTYMFPVIIDGYLSLTFDMAFSDNSQYRITITEDDEIVYRGKLFVTSQADNTQAYKIANDIFIYG